MVLGKLPVPGRPTNLERVEQGPSVLAVGAGGGCLDIFSLVYHFSFSLSVVDGPISTEILSQRAVKPKQPTNQLWGAYSVETTSILTLKNVIITLQKNVVLMAVQRADFALTSI